MRILLTGAAGFIGLHSALRLLARGDEVVGVDNLNAYYEVSLKEARLAQLQRHPGFRFERLDLTDAPAVADLFRRTRPERVLHLGAQAGVRHSLEQPQSYVDSNLSGFLQVLEGCRHHGVGHLVYASSSSVYGLNSRMPFRESDAVDHPLSLYAASKKANELMAHSYSHLYGIPTTGLRFFTVYGPWGRPDMAFFSFTRDILAGRPIRVFNHGQMSRDFTYIDDIVEGVIRTLDKPATPDAAFDTAQPDPGRGLAPYRVFNIGHGAPTALLDYIEALEEALGRRAEKEFLPMQPGDVTATWADTTALADWVGFKPQVSVAQGVPLFVDWFKRYYHT